MKEVKTCTYCKQSKPITEFRSRGGKMKHLLKSRCNKCLFTLHKKWCSENEEKVKEYRGRDPWTLFKRCNRRNISVDEFSEMYHSQSGKCSICETEITMIDSAIDHNHDTGKFRGILCKKCNRAIGLFSDSPKKLKSAYEYLIKNTFYGDI